MSDRWVCPACSTRNEAVNYSCQRCGQVRDMSVGDGPPVPNSAPLPRRRRARSRAWIGFVWVPIVLGFLIVPLFTDARRDGSGSITRAGSLSVHDLQVGDCFDFHDPDATELDTVRGIPCSQSHESEVFAMTELAAGPYPSDTQFDVAFETTCLAAFAGYVGTYYQDSEVYADMIVPLPDGWEEGDRTITCYLFLLDGPVVGSLRDSRR